jgi:nitrite reductase/ring-hydroxylating ferredoxin subunit
VELLGERFVAFRDSNGRIGCLDEACCHRGASLFLARVEDCGIRCIYHGWKFGVDGEVLETPNVNDPEFKTRFRMRAYPVREAGGLLWIFPGPAGAEPRFPRWPWLSLPDSHVLTSVHVAAGRAAREGLALCLEPTNARTLPGMLFNHFDEACALVRRLGQPAVRMIYDTAHIQSMDGDLVGRL